MSLIRNIAIGGAFVICAGVAYDEYQIGDKDLERCDEIRESFSDYAEKIKSIPTPEGYPDFGLRTIVRIDNSEVGGFMSGFVKDCHITLK